MIDTNQITSSTDSTTTDPSKHLVAQTSYQPTNLASNIPSSEYEVEAGGKWNLADDFIHRLVEDPEFEETVISSIRKIERYLNRRGYMTPEFKGEIEYYQEKDVNPDYRLRVTIDISDASEWLEIEDRIQEIVVDTEVGEAELYVVVDRQRA